MYYLAGVIASIEGLDPVQAGNRWSLLKNKCAAETSRVSGKNTVDEINLRLVLPLMKNTDQKRAAMTARGMAVVREIVFQGLDGLPVRIEVDTTTEKMSIKEVVVALGFTVHAAELQIAAIKAKYPDIAEAIGAPMCINGVNNPKLCAGIELMLQLIWMLPSNPLTTAFRLKCAEDIARQLRGDTSLVHEIEHNHTLLEQTGTLRFLVVPSIDKLKPLAPSPTLSICGSTLGPYAFDEHGMYDLVRLLVAAIGWDIAQCTREWVDLCIRHPRLHSGWLHQANNVLYVPKSFLIDLAESVDWGAVVLRYTGQAEHEVLVDTESVASGMYSPITIWCAARTHAPPRLTWMRIYVGLDGVSHVELAAAIGIRYSKTKAQVVRMRSQFVSDNVRAGQDIVPIACDDGVVRQCISLETLRQMTVYLDRKAEAEAERMHEHDTAKRYIHDRVCEVEVVCTHCGQVNRMRTTGQRQCEYPWLKYRLDVAVVLGGEVVAAIEIMRTSAVSATKLRDLAADGIEWAEVRATNVIEASLNGVHVVRAIKGGGICRDCTSAETRTRFLLRMAECDEREERALKRQAEIANELADVNATRIQLRTKFARHPG